MYHVTMNAAPSRGRCTVAREDGLDQNGVFLRDLYRVACEGFSDPDGVASFEIGMDVDGVDFFFTPSVAGQATLYPPEGISLIKVRVTDRHGSARIVETQSVTVEAPVSQTERVGLALSRLIEVSDTGDEGATLQLLAALRGEQDASVRAKMAAALHSLTAQLALTPATARRVMQAALLVADAEMALEPLQALGDVIERIATFDLLGSSGKSPAEQAVSLADLVVRSAARLADDENSPRNVTSPDSVALATALEALLETALKAHLLGRGAEVRVSHEGVEAYGVTRPALAILGNAVQMPDVAERVSLTLPVEMSSVPGMEDALLDVELALVRRAVADSADGTILSGAVTATVSHTNDIAPELLEGLPGEVLVTVPISTVGMQSGLEAGVYAGSAIQCVHWIGADAESPLQPGPWSSSGCRVAAVEPVLDAAGEPQGLGTVTCACTHLTTFAVRLNSDPVRFVAPTPAWGDVFQVESGNAIAFDVAATTFGDGTTSVVLGGVSGAALLSYEAPELSPGANGTYVFSWVPRDPGDFTIELTLLWTAADGTEYRVETRAVRARVLFCEHFLQAGETLRDVAAAYSLSWQALFVLNPEIANPRVVRAVEASRTWQCGAQGCAMLGPLSGARVRIGRVLTLEAGQHIHDVVESLGATYTQLARHNIRRIESLAGLPASSPAVVFDIENRHNSSGAEVPYTGESMCIVSPLSDSCFA